jgi:uncharacterized protein (TIGR02217 family)
MTGYTVTQPWNVFPALPGLTWSVVKRPIWKTLTQESVSGQEATASLFTYPIWEWELVYEVLRADATNHELQTLMAFFNQQQGMTIPFCYEDPTDKTSVAQQFGTGDGTTRTFQLVRFLLNTGNYFDPIFAPHGECHVYIGGVEKTPTTDYAISSTGVVTFVSAPANASVLTWSGSYYWLVRFLADQSDFENFMYQLWENKKIGFRSKKL